MLRIVNMLVIFGYIVHPRMIARLVPPLVAVLNGLDDVEFGIDKPNQKGSIRTFLSEVRWHYMHNVYLLRKLCA